MEPRDFCYWLQGYFELHCGKEIKLDAQQVEMIKEHLALVFEKKTKTIENLWDESNDRWKEGICGLPEDKKICSSLDNFSSPGEEPNSISFGPHTIDTTSC